MLIRHPFTSDMLFTLDRLNKAMELLQTSLDVAQVQHHMLWLRQWFLDLTLVIGLALGFFLIDLRFLGGNTNAIQSIPETSGHSEEDVI